MHGPMYIKNHWALLGKLSNLCKWYEAFYLVGRKGILNVNWVLCFALFHALGYPLQIC